MNKTRMGKRAASLLLSLVMMLSLLPTAAYAAMADGVDTQGASVSENGTGVSDDSNSSGNTDDLQVGGSSGSGTADDPAGAEGGADPTDSVNENDSADPQDDGDAVMPVASSMVSTSEELVAAIAAANDGDTITLGEGEFTTYGNTSPEKSLTFVGAGTGTVWTIGDLDKDVGGEGNGDYSFEGCDTITFKNMTLKVDNKNYRGFIRINHTVVENCTLEGRTAYWGYETAKFVGSTFTAPEGDYALWDYSTKDMSFDGCKFNISGKGVHVYVEAANADKDVTRTVAVNNCTVNSTKANKAFLNIKNSTQSYDVTLSGTNTVNGLTADGTTGSALYQVETTEVTETTGNPVTVKQANTAGELETVYEVKQPSANVAKVGGTEYATLEAAIAALSSSSYTLELLDKSAWNEATPVYWAAGSKSGYAATLADALTAAYKANGDITIVCRPGADVGKLTHGHVADDITIYGNNAYISSGECELEVDTFMFSRDTGKQATSGGAYLDKDITVTAYELDNLGVWGERHTDHKVTVNLTDCDSVDGITVQRVYISGTTGVNDITLTGCDFGTKATSVYSNADGEVVIDNCSFTGAQVPVNFNHKANGTQTVTVQNSTFTKCGDNGDWKQFAAPVRFVNSGSGTMTTTVGTCTFTDTVGGNGDILLGDGRVGEKSNDVKLTVENTAANVQAQQPGYYAKDGTTDETKQGTKNVAAGDKLTTSVTQLMPSSETTYVAEVKGVKYDSLQAAINAAARNATVTMLADTRENVTIAEAMTLDLNGHTLNGGTEKGKPALTVTARVTVKDSSAAQTGTIMREDTAENSGVSSHYVIDIQGKGWLTFESGNVKNNSGTDSGKGASLVRVGDDSVAKYPGLNIKGGTFTQDNFIVIKVDSGDLFLNGGTLNSANSYAIEDWHRATIKGGTVNGTVAVWTYSGGHNSDLTIEGGTVNGNVASVSYDKTEGKVAKVSITGGTVTGTLGTYTYGNGLIPFDDAAKATIEVTGGTFSEAPTKYVVEDSAITPNADGTFGVAKAYLAKVGETSYYTMDEAFKAQTASGKAIVLLRDYTTGSTFNSGSIDRTVDLNGHTWTCTGTDANSAAFEINYPDATLTVKNGKVFSSQLVGLIPSAMGGTIKYDNSSLVFDGVEMTTNARSGIETNGNNTNDTVTLKNSTLNVPNGFGIYFPSSGTLTIDNSKINAKTMGVQVCSGSLNISGADTAITVSGDGIDKTINDGAIEDGAAISIVNRIGYKGLSKIEVTGGTFTAKGDNAAVKAYKWENQTASAFDNSENVVAISGGTFSSAVDKSLCADGFIPTRNTDGTYGVKEETRGTEARPYTLAELGVMTRAEYVAAQEALGGTMYVAVGNYTYDKNGVLGNGERNDTPGQNPDHSKLNAYGENGYLNEKNDGANGKNIVFVNGSITSGATGYTSIDNIGTSLLLAVPAYTNVTFKGITFNNVMSFNYQLYTSPWSQLGELKFDGCTFNGIIVGAIAAQTLTFNGCTFTNYTNTTKANNSNPTWIRPAYGNWTAGDNKGQGDNFRSLTKINFTGNTVTSTRPVKFEYISQWDIRSTVTVTNNSFDISAQEGDTEIKNVGLYLGAHTKTNAFDLVADGNTKSDNTAALYTIPEGETSLPLGSTVTNTNGDQIELADALKWKAADAEQDKIVLKTVKAVASVDTVNFATLTEAIDAAQDGQTVTLLADAAEDVVISKSITLDLGGKTLTNTNVGKATISVQSGTVTVKNGNVVGGNDYYNIEAKKDANLTLTDVTATAGNNGSSMIDNWGTLTITSGTYTGGLNVVKSEEDSVLNISGGTFTLSYATSGYTGVIFAYGDTTISGGEFIQSLTTTGRWNHPQVIATGVVEGHTAITKVTGGSFTNKLSRENIFRGVGKATSDNFKVSGGTFNKSISDAYCADGFIPTKNADGTYGVKEGKFVAEVGSKKYETLADAIRLTAKGKTVRLLADVEQNTQLTIDKSITLDLNGKTIKISGYTAEKAQVSVKGNLTIQDSSEAQTGKICSDYTGTAGRVVSVENGGKLTIAGGTITTEGMSGLSGSAVYIASGAEVNMTGGAVKVDAKRGNVAMNVKGSTGVFTMSGGSVIAEAGDGTETYITAISGSSGSTIQISAGTVSGPQALLAGSSATTITGGNFTGSITVKNGSISGGTFDRALDKKACAAGYVPTQNGDGTYGVEIGMFTVMVTSRTTGSNSPVANVAGGGSNITYAQGTTVTASAISGYKFVGWFVNEYTGTPYSTDLTCEVKPTDDCTMIAVYEPISGGVFALEVSASKFTVNDGATQRSYLLEKMPIGTQVTVVFKGSENFLYWVNESGKVVSTSKTYTFSMGSATTLKAVYAEKEENQAMVVFISHTQQVISSKDYTDTQEIQFPEPPIKMGATFVRWSMTEAEIRAAMATTATGIIVVEPVYEFSAGSYTVTVNYPNDETATYTATVGKITTVTAKSIDGKVFKCWKNGDTVLGYTETLKVAPRGDLILTAEYVDAGTTVDRLPVIALTEISASQQGAKYAVSFTATRSVPDGYTVTEQGVLVSTDSRYGETGALDAMKLDADGVKPDDTKILKATNTDATGVTVLNGIVSAADRTVYGRAYMILRDSSGTMVYVYSDTILSGSYNSLTTNGGN